MEEFHNEVRALCRELMRWRVERQRAASRDDDALPPFEKKAGLQSLIFFIALLVATYIAPFVQGSESATAKLSWAIATVTSTAAAPVLLLFQAMGLGKAQFWRALWSLTRRPKRPEERMPFSSLFHALSVDAAATARLRTYRTCILEATSERLESEEKELQERLGVVVGSPSLALVFGAAAGGLTAWQNYHAHQASPLHLAVFVTALLVLGFAFLGFQLRGSIGELMRCRALLKLELARRKAAQPKEPISLPQKLSGGDGRRLDLV